MDGVKADGSPFPAAADKEASPHIVAETKRKKSVDVIELPVELYKDKIQELVRNHFVSIILGETGSGKTTRIPQFLTDDPGLASVLDVDKVRVMVTQPRRVAACAMAERVADERGVPVGEEVGYAVRFDDRSSAKTRIKYVTDGVALRALLETGSFTANAEAGYYFDGQVFMVDEAHERSLNTDILFALIKRAAAASSNKRLRVVISSASLDADKFSRFFNDAPVLRIPGRVYPVAIHYCPVLDWTAGEEGPPKKRKLDNHHEGGGGGGGGGRATSPWVVPARGVPSSAQVVDAAVNAALRLHLERSLNDDDDDEENTGRTVGESSSLDDDEENTGRTVGESSSPDDDDDDQENTGNILVFLTGQAECEAACSLMFDRMERSRGGGRHIGDALVLPLYGALSSADQHRLFVPAPEGCRKIIFATNVAETSLTIDGVETVVDSGLVKQKRYHAKTGVETLSVVKIAKSQALQRAGRAGRVRPGRCFRLFSEEEFAEFPESPVVEIQRASLRSVVLQLKALGVSDVCSVEFVDPPSKEFIVAAAKDLFLLGTLSKTAQLTQLGRRVVSLPLDPIFASCLIAAVQTDVAVEVAGVVAMLSVDNVWTRAGRRVQANHGRPRDDWPEGKRKFCHWSGDHLTLLRALEEFERCAPDRRRRWCAQYGLQMRAMNQARDIHEQLLSILWRSRKTPLASSTKQKFPVDERVLAALCQGCFLNAARETSSSLSHSMRGAIAAADQRFWVTLKDGALVRLDRSSVLRAAEIDRQRFSGGEERRHERSSKWRSKQEERLSLPSMEYVIFSEVVSQDGGERLLSGSMRIVSRVRKEWIQNLIPRFSEVGKTNARKKTGPLPGGSRKTEKAEALESVVYSPARVRVNLRALVVGRREAASDGASNGGAVEEEEEAPPFSTCVIADPLAAEVDQALRRKMDEEKIIQEATERYFARKAAAPQRSS